MAERLDIQVIANTSKADAAIKELYRYEGIPVKLRVTASTGGAVKALTGLVGQAERLQGILSRLKINVTGNKDLEKILGVSPGKGLKGGKGKSNTTYMGIATDLKRQMAAVSKQRMKLRKFRDTNMSMLSKGELAEISKQLSALDKVSRMYEKRYDSMRKAAAKAGALKNGKWAQEQPVADSEQIKKADNATKHANYTRANAEKIQSQFNERIAQATSEQKKLNQQQKEQEKIAKRQQAIEDKARKSRRERVASKQKSIAEYESDKQKEAIKTAKEYAKEQSRIEKSRDVNSNYAQLSKELDKVTALKLKLDKAMNSGVNKNYFANNGTMQQMINGTKSVSESLSREMENLKKIQATGRQTLTSDEYKKTGDLLKSTREQTAAYQSQYAVIQNNASIMHNATLEASNLSKIYDKTTNFLNANRHQWYKAPDQYQQFSGLLKEINSGAISSGDAKRKFEDIRMSAEQAGVGIRTFRDQVVRTFTSQMSYQLVSMGMMTMLSGLRDIVTNVTEVDTAMTELKKVTDETDSTYASFLQDAGKRAQQVGATLKETVNATADYARLGYNIEDASQLADTALIYTNVGDDVENIDQATASLISTMQGFGMEASDAMSIVDKFNEVANNYASSAGDIGQITQRSAASMAAAGNTLDETNYCLDI